MIALLLNSLILDWKNAGEISGTTTIKSYTFDLEKVGRHNKTLINAVKSNLTELTTKSTSIPLAVSSVLICACTRIPCVLRLRRVGSHYSDSVYSAREHVFKVVSPSPLPSLSFHCLISVMGSCLPFHIRGSWLGYQDLPAIGAVSILELRLPIVGASGCLWRPTSI